MTLTSPLRAAAPLAVAAALLFSACGSDDDDDAAAGGGDGAATSTAAAGAAPADYAAVKGYLAEHTARLVTETGKLREGAQQYHDLAESVDFDYDELLSQHADEVAPIIEKLQTDFRAANPAYEEMEGVVAGVPELADYDVTIDAGGDASDPENAVPFTIKTKAGKEYKQPGNFFFITETAIFGTEDKFAAKGVKPDLDGDGEIAFGESLPDSDFLQAATVDFEQTAKDLQASGEKWTPEASDVFTAVVVMTPTMSEYFEAWKNSRFVAGSKATESGFVGASRLEDIASILSGLVVIYDNIEPQIAEEDPEQAEQTGASLDELLAFVQKVRDEEKGGKRFTAEEAETLGTDAQEQAEAIAGQVSQAAGKLDIELEEG
jgi:hypothetical protein